MSKFKVGDKVRPTKEHKKMCDVCSNIGELEIVAVSVCDEWLDVKEKGDNFSTMSIKMEDVELLSTKIPRFKVQSENGLGTQKAMVFIYDEWGKLEAEIEGEVVLKQGADGGYYHCVELKVKVV